MNMIYFFLTYTWVLILVSMLTGCVGMIEALEDEDWVAIGTTMQTTGRNIQREQHEQKMKPQQPVFIQQRPVGAVCTMELVANPIYGHYEPMEICR